MSNNTHSTAPSYSIIIPAYNEEDFLPQCLRSLQAQEFDKPFEIIVVDNNSSDSTTKVAKSFEGVRVLLETERGVCAARQAGYEVAKAPIVISTDADTTFNKDWLKKIDETFTRNPNIVGVAGTPSFVDSPFWGYLLVGVITAWVRGYNKLFRTTSYVSAANLAFKKSAFKGYNTLLTQGGDELYVLKELKKHGKLITRFDNPVFTSSRRLYRGFFYNVIVTQLIYYVLDYNLARITGRSIFGGYPAFRKRTDYVLQKRNIQVGLLALLFIATTIYYWKHDEQMIRSFENRIHSLEQRVRDMRTKR